MNKCLILTDLTYQTKSSSKTTHDIEAGLNNLGVASIKVYQLLMNPLKTQRHSCNLPEMR